MYYDGVISKPLFDELYHHGVKGMKWGVRKDDTKKKSGTKKKKSRTDTLSKNEARQKVIHILNQMEQQRIFDENVRIFNEQNLINEIVRQQNEQITQQVVQQQIMMTQPPFMYF